MSPGSGGLDSPAEGPFSSEVLTELRTLGGEKLVAELMEIFAERTPERLRSAEGSAASGDLEAAASALHSLRSASGTVGARRVAELAGRLERAARDGDAAKIDEQLPELRRLVSEALSAAARLA